MTDSKKPRDYKKLGPQLLNACYFGNQSLAIKLIRDGADPHYIDPRDGWAGIHYSARWGQLPVVKSLVAAGVSINMQTTGKETPLHKACRTNRTKLCVWLLRHGADPNALNVSREKPSDLSISKEVKFVCDHFDEYCKIMQSLRNENAEKESKK